MEETRLNFVTTLNDLSALCRVCLQQPEESQLLNLHAIYDEEEQLTYDECFTVCTKIDLIEGEKLPHCLCKFCGLELQVAYDFHKKVNISKRVLRQWCEKRSVRNHLLPDVHEIDTERSSVQGFETIEISSVEQLESKVDGEVLEEHLDLEDFEAVENLDLTDAETISRKVDLKSDDEDIFIIETIILSEEEAVKLEIEEDNKMWKHAVVGVAKNSHLAKKNEISQKTNNIALTDNEYLNQEVVFVETNSMSYTSDKPHATFKSETQTNFGRKRYIGKFACDICDKVFPNHSRMIWHRRSHEPDRPKFNCPECSRKYATKQAMEIHVRSVHTKMGYVCSFCDKVYAIRKSLEVHMRYHTGDFPFACDACDRKFAQVSHLNTHKNVKHNSVRFSCDHPDCGKYFTSSSSLRNHEFSHSSMPFECEFCERGYPAKAKLKVHIKRKHDQIMSQEQLEKMRKFTVQRAKLRLVQLVVPESN